MQGNRTIFFLLFFVSFLFCSAHAPILNYEKINVWCAQVNLSKSELQSFANYLEVGKELSQACAKDPHFINSEQGKELQQQMDAMVEEFMKDTALKDVFQRFIVLVKEELEENVHEHKNTVKRNYRLMVMIYEGCLRCVQQKLQIL